MALTRCQVGRALLTTKGAADATLGPLAALLGLHPTADAGFANAVTALIPSRTSAGRTEPEAQLHAGAPSRTVAVTASLRALFAPTVVATTTDALEAGRATELLAVSSAILLTSPKLVRTEPTPPSMDVQRADRQLSSRKDPDGLGLIGDGLHTKPRAGAASRRPSRRSGSSASGPRIPLLRRPFAAPTSYRVTKDGLNTTTTCRSMPVLPVQAAKENHEDSDDERRETPAGEVRPPAISNLRPPCHTSTATRAVERGRNVRKETLPRIARTALAEATRLLLRRLGPGPVVGPVSILVQRSVAASRTFCLSAQAAPATSRLLLEAARRAPAVADPSPER